MLGWWKIGRASGVGATAGLIALFLWPFYRSHPGSLMWPFAAAAAIAGLCGLSILLITAIDIVQRRRGARIRPVRGFDILFGLFLVGISLLQLDDVQGQLPASAIAEPID